MCHCQLSMHLYSICLAATTFNTGITEKKHIHLSSKYNALYLGQLLLVDLIKWVSNVRPPVRTSVRPSTESFFDFSEILYVGRGRRLMHDGMQYDPIQRQGQGHEPLKVVIRPFSKVISSPIYNGGWQMTTYS